VDVEEHVEQRHVLGLRGPDRLDAELEQHAAGLRGHVAVHPGGRCLAVELRGVRGLPRSVQGHLPREPVEPGLGLLHVDEHRRVDARDRARVAADAPSVLEQVVSVRVGGEGLDAQLAGERGQTVLRGADPLAADLDDLAVPEILVQDTASDAVARL
jgi:hypothetical protein